MPLLMTQLPVFLLLSCMYPVVGHAYSLGESLTPLRNTRWMSPSQVFAFGFLHQNSQNYSLSIYYNLQPLNNTIVWTVHWGQTVSSTASLKLEEDGNLVLTDGGTQIWQTNTGSQGVKSAAVSEIGALQLLDKASNVVWQSSSNQSLTDTILPGQTLPPYSNLISEQGLYVLAMQGDYNLVLYSFVTSSSQVAPYWASGTDGNVTLSAVFDSAGNFKLVNETGDTVMIVAAMKQLPMPKYVRLRLTGEGLLQFYGWDEGQTSWTAYERLPSDSCGVPGVCGHYGVCSSQLDQDDLRTSCECPPGFLPVDNYSTAGCKPQVPVHLTSGTKFVKLSGTQYISYYDFAPRKVDSAQQCVETCSNTFWCMAAQLNEDKCQLINLGQLYGGNKLNTNSVVYLRVSRSASSGADDPWTQGSSSTSPNVNKADHPSTAAIVSIAIASVLTVALVLSNVVWFLVTRKRGMYEETESDGGGDILAYDTIPGAPVKFSYAQLQAATNRFREKLGGGGFGSVYKGVLAGGSTVAVKQLESLNQGSQQFQAEVMTIGAIHHINLVRLRGFCAERSHKLLVYEFMSNGSLDKYLFSTIDNECPPKTLDWSRRFSVAYGTAKAICYLHEDCMPSIIHCDIKPENILLDADFSPKVSDFGLAKLTRGDKVGSTTSLRSTLSVRGTGGYMAPEWMSAKQITVKVDVYSYGIVLLEMISGRRNVDVEQRDSRIIYRDWAYGQVSVGNLMKVVDPDLEGEADEVEVERMAKVAFWCIQEDHNSRPSMHRVIQMLNGTTDVPIPPPPYGCSSIDMPCRLHDDTQILLPSSF